jgi:hypothetical protein
MSSLKPKSGCLQRLRRMPCFALQNRGGKLNWLGGNFVVDGSCGAFGAALVHHIACTGFTATALRSDTQLELDFVETHARMRVARDLAV